MKYSELISFKPIESTIQLLDANQELKARELVETYVMSDTMADQLKTRLIDQLQMDESSTTRASSWWATTEPVSRT